MVRPVTEDSGQPSKRCKTCGQIKPLTEFYSDSGKGNRDGHRTRCKPCFNEDSQKRRLENQRRGAAARGAFPGSRTARCSASAVASGPATTWPSKSSISASTPPNSRRRFSLTTVKSASAAGRRDFDYLTVDHIDGNGGEHRVELFGSNKAAGRVFSPLADPQWIPRRIPDPLQVLQLQQGQDSAVPEGS